MYAERRNRATISIEGTNENAIEFVSIEIAHFSRDFKWVREFQLIIANVFETILRSNNRPPQQQLLRTCERIVTTYLNGEVLPHKTLYSYNLFTNTNTIAQKMGKHVYVHSIQHRYTGKRLSLNSAQSIESIAEFDISVKCFTEAHILWKIEQMLKSKLRQRVHKFEPDLYALVILLSHFNGFLLQKHFAFDFSAYCCCCCCWLWKIHTWKRAKLIPIHTSTTALYHHYIFIIKIWKICAFAYSWVLFFWLCICKWLCDLYIVVPLCFYSKFFKLAIIVEEHGRENKQTKQEHTQSFWNSIILLNAKSSQFEVPAFIYVNFMRNMYGRVRTRFAKKINKFKSKASATITDIRFKLLMNHPINGYFDVIQSFLFFRRDLRTLFVLSGFE